MADGDMESGNLQKERKGCVVENSVLFQYQSVKTLEIDEEKIRYDITENPDRKEKCIFSYMENAEYSFCCIICAFFLLYLGHYFSHAESENRRNKQRYPGAERGDAGLYDTDAEFRTQSDSEE